MTSLLNAVCFAWPATTFAAMRYASRLMIERYRPWNRVSSKVADRNRDTQGQTEMQMYYQGRRETISGTNYFLGGMSQVGNKTSNNGCAQDQSSQLQCRSESCSILRRSTSPSQACSFSRAAFDQVSSRPSCSSNLARIATISRSVRCVMRETHRPEPWQKGTRGNCASAMTPAIAWHSSPRLVYLVGEVISSVSRENLPYGTWRGPRRGFVA